MADLEPVHFRIGSNWKAPAPVSPVESEHPWLWLLYAAAIVGGCALPALIWS